MNDPTPEAPMSPEESRRRQELADIVETLALPAARRFITRLINQSGAFFSSSFSTEPLVMALREGRRDIGHFIITEIDDADPKRLLDLLQESKRQEHLASVEKSSIPLT